jgi:hypothetical protein
VNRSGPAAAFRLSIAISAAAGSSSPLPAEQCAARAVGRALGMHPPATGVEAGSGAARAVLVISRPPPRPPIPGHSD